jgi:hypothetical protein
MVASTFSRGRPGSAICLSILSRTAGSAFANSSSRSYFALSRTAMKSA